MEPKLSTEIEMNIENVKMFIFYLLVFYFIWTLKELWLIKYIESFGETTYALLEAQVKIVVWIVPTWLYIIYFLNTNPISYLKMNVNVKRGYFLE